MISYDEMLEMASAGAQVLNARSVEFAKNFGIKIHVRPTFNEKEGTIVMQETKAMEKVVISGVTYNKNEAKVTVRGVSRPAGGRLHPLLQTGAGRRQRGHDHPEHRGEGPFGRFLHGGPERTQKDHEGGHTRRPRTLKPAGVISDENIAKVSVVGVGMRSHSGVAAKMFKALAEEEVNIQMISTSEIKISVVIDQKDVAKAVSAIHEKFNQARKWQAEDNKFDFILNPKKSFGMRSFQEQNLKVR